MPIKKCWSLQQEKQSTKPNNACQNPENSLLKLPHVFLASWTIAEGPFCQHRTPAAWDGCHTLSEGTLPVPPCPATLFLQAPCCFSPCYRQEPGCVTAAVKPRHLSWCNKSCRAIRIWHLCLVSVTYHTCAETADNTAGCFTRTCKRKGWLGREKRVSSHSKPSCCAW